MNLEIWNYVMAELLFPEINQLQILVDLADFFEGEIIDDFTLELSTQTGESQDGNNVRTEIP